MLSGGVDSLYVLHHLLTTTDDELWVHHVHLINREGRHRAEARACEEIVAWCRQHLRPFRYTESTIDHSAFEVSGRDVLSVALEAGLIAQNAWPTTKKHLDRWVLGYCLEESQEIVAGQTVGSSNRRRIIETAVNVTAFPITAPPLASLELIPKHQELEALPRALAALAWTCRTPRLEADVFVECGQCKTCRLMEVTRGKLTSTYEWAPRRVSAS
jgi:7-cyano-7-deazaguanine synthase in queuosine biosynthesis